MITAIVVVVAIAVAIALAVAVVYIFAICVVRQKCSSKMSKIEKPERVEQEIASVMSWERLGKVGKV